MSDYPDVTVTLEDTSTDARYERESIPVKIEADPYGISLILPGGEEFYLEYHNGRYWLRHYEYQEDKHPVTLLNREPKETIHDQASS